MNSKYNFLNVMVIGPTTKNNFLIVTMMKLIASEEVKKKTYYMTAKGALYIPPKHNKSTLTNLKRASDEVCWALEKWEKPVKIDFPKPHEKDGKEMYRMAIALAETIYEKPVAEITTPAVETAKEALSPAKLTIAHVSSDQIEKFNRRKAQQQSSKKKHVSNNLGANMEEKNPGILEKIKSAFK